MKEEIDLHSKEQRLLIVDFERDFALRGIPFIREHFDQLKVTGLLARNVDSQVHQEFKDISIFDKLISEAQLLNYSAQRKIPLAQIRFLANYEDQIHYNTNRYYNTELVFDYSLIKFKIIEYCTDIIETCNPQIVYFGVTPHDPISYLVYLIARFKKIQTVMINKCHPLHGYFLYQTIGKQSLTVLEAPRKEDESQVKKDVVHIQKCLKTIVETEPAYMTKQKKQFGSKFRKLQHALLVKKRFSIVGYQRYKDKLKEREAYQKQAVINSEEGLAQLKGKIIYFPMHYQPELTTSPDGGDYTQQWLAAKHMVEALPEDGYLLVKEHPSQFFLNAKKVRSSIFYEALRAISDKVRLVDLGLSSDKIMKYVHGVATITGTAAYEAILTGTPAIYFGDAKYAGIKGTYSFIQIQEFIEAVQKNEKVEPQEVFDDFNRYAASAYFFALDRDKEHEENHLEGIRVLLTNYLNQ